MRKVYLTAALSCVAVAVGSGCAPLLEILPLLLPNGAEGSVYRETLTASGDPPYRWEISAGNLPSGMQIDEDRGILLGTPSESGTFNFTVSVRAGGFFPGQGQILYSLTILEELTADTTVPNARVGQAYDHTFVAAGGVPPYQYALIGLPGGLTFDAQTATISGTPLVDKTSINLQLTVTDSGDPQQTVQNAIQLTVKPQPIAITTDALPDGQVGIYYSTTVQAENGASPYTWTITAGILPAGATSQQNVRLDATTGVISGTPAESGTFAINVKVTDSDTPPTTDSKQLTIEIAE